MNLRKLNQREWDKVPFTLRLVGGPFDGQEITCGHLPRIWRHPVETSVTDLLTLTETSYPVSRTIEYTDTDQVADDGAHLYEVRKS